MNTDGSEPAGGQFSGPEGGDGDCEPDDNTYDKFACDAEEFSEPGTDSAANRFFHFPAARYFNRPDAQSRSDAGAQHGPQKQHGNHKRTEYRARDRACQGGKRASPTCSGPFGSMHTSEEFEQFAQNGQNHYDD